MLRRAKFLGPNRLQLQNLGFLEGDSALSYCTYWRVWVHFQL